jgi:hypothetical protein
MLASFSEVLLVDALFFVMSVAVSLLLTWVTWLLISIGPGGSSLEMLLASVASARS